jgi:hypothetical protein
MTIVRNDGTWRSMLEHSERIAQFVLGRLASPYVISNSAASIFCDI